LHFKYDLGFNPCNAEGLYWVAVISETDGLGLPFCRVIIFDENTLTFVYANHANDRSSRTDDTAWLLWRSTICAIEDRNPGGGGDILPMLHVTNYRLQRTNIKLGLNDVEALGLTVTSEIFQRTPPPLTETTDSEPHDEYAPTYHAVMAIDDDFGYQDYHGFTQIFANDSFLLVVDESVSHRDTYVFCFDDGIEPPTIAGEEVQEFKLGKVISVGDLRS